MPTSPFVLSRRGYNVEAGGVQRTFSSLTDAVAAVRSGSTVVGALPFDVTDPVALVEPTSLVRTDGPWRAEERTQLPEVHIGEQVPASDMHVERVRALVDSLRRGTAQKVVLARSLRLQADAAIAPLALLDALVGADPLGNGYAVDLSAAGGEHTGRYLVGSSPELLVRRHGSIVSCHPFAGTAARSADPAIDAVIAEQLAASAKDQAEHRFVVDEIKAALEPLCTDIEVPATPQLSSTPQLWHLSSPITGVLRDPGTTALDLALALHPTAAVAGVPRMAAMAAISRIEGPRGFYAGAVGWTDGSGDGEWMVAIRCLVLAADGRSALATAGGGIVEASDPDAELAETTAKFRTVLAALGLA
ncbi:isochorismate synthase [Rhodococcoides yunnanense]|uniref:isochorismate synthase n=1 Tax=Rhodococcoides yunnanense TaxID=278209 RepID=UPI00093523F6|nr:isochorismate synthase [Rhodococcus yunnanensis]